MAKTSTRISREISKESMTPPQPFDAVIRSREIALHCAASLPCHLLFRGWTRSKGREIAAEVHKMPYDAIRHIDTAVAIQLTKCADEAAQRLILGKSK